MSSKDNAIGIDCDSDESKTPTDNQVEVNPDDYVQPDVPSRAFGIGSDDFVLLTYETKDIDIMRHPYFWMEQSHIASFIRVIQGKSPNVHFVEKPILPAIDYNWEKLPASVKIYSRNMNTGHHTTNQNGHCVHFSVYKDIQKIVIAEACVEGATTWREEYSTVIKQLLYGIGWVEDASKVKLFEDNGYGDKWAKSRWGVHYIHDASENEHIPNCGPFVMAASEYAYEGNSDWSEFLQIKKVFADRNEVLDRFKENLIVYLNNLQKKDTSWNDEEYEYAMQVRDNLEGKVKKRSNNRGDSKEKKSKKGKRNKY